MPTQNSRQNVIELSGESCLSETLPGGEPLLTKAKRLRKAGGKGWSEPANFITPSEARERRESGKNYGFALGYGTEEWNLVAFDVETKGVLPDEAQALIDEHALLVWDSVHSGQNRLVKVTDDAFNLLDSLTTAYNHLSNGADDDLEFQTSGHCIGPDCEIAHKYCNDTKADCPGTGRDTYELVKSKSFAPVVTEEVAERILGALEIDREKEESPQNDSPAEKVSEVPEYDDTDVAAVEAHLQTLQANSYSAFKCLSDRLNGGTGNKENLRLESDLIDRSATDFVTVSDLYGVMVVLGNENEQRARELAYAYYNERCDTYRGTKEDGRIRKWLSIGDKYRKNILQHAVSQFDRGQFQRWLNHRDTHADVPWFGQMDGKYSDPTRDFTLFALYLLAGELPLDADSLEFTAIEGFNLDVDSDIIVDTLSAVRGDVAPHPRYKDRNPPSVRAQQFLSQSEYPTKSEISELAQAIDKGRNNETKTYGNALGRFNREGRVSHAFCRARTNGERHVYYPSHLPDPDDATWVKTEGEQEMVD